MKTACNWEDLLTQDTATYNELASALWEGYEDKMELALVCRLDDGSEWEFGVSHYGDRLSLKWSEEDTPKAIRRAVEDFLFLHKDCLHEIERIEWRCVGHYFENQCLFHVNLPNRPHAVVFFRIYHADNNH